MPAEMFSFCFFFFVIIQGEQMWKLCKLLISGCFIDCNGSVAMRACDRLCASLRLVEVLICANAVCICVFDEVIRLVTFTFKEDLSCLHIHHFYTLVSYLLQIFGENCPVFACET